MILINILAKIGKGLEKAVRFTAESIYNGGKYAFDTPREIKKMSDEKRKEEDRNFLFQVVLYHTGKSRLSGIKKLRENFPSEYNELLPTINRDNARFNIEPMLPV